MKKVQLKEIARQAVALCRFDNLPVNASNLVDALDELGYLIRDAELRVQTESGSGQIDEQENKATTDV